jgi:hypothetical protein
MAILSLVHGNAESVTQSMDKEDVLMIVLGIILVLAIMTGYVAGMYRG